MPRKRKKKLTPAQRAEKMRRREEFMTIFINGKQKRVRRPPTIDGMDVDEFIARNADPIWLHQHEMWELMEPEPVSDYLLSESGNPDPDPAGDSEPDEDGHLPF